MLLQVSATLVPALLLPEWIQSGVAFFLIIGFPIALLLAWAYELKPEGSKQNSIAGNSSPIAIVTGRKMDFVIIGLLVVAVGYFAYDNFSPEIINNPTSTEETNPANPQESETSIAVLPFVNMSDDASNEYFSDGLSEELLNLLAKIPELRVTARTSSFSFRDQNLEVTEIAERLNVAHVQ